MGGSSGSNSDDSSGDDSDVTDEGLQQSRGRPLAKKAEKSRRVKGAAGIADKAAGAQPPPRRTGSARRESPVHLHQRRTFTRSRSPALNAANGFHFGTSIHPPRPSSPSLFSRQKPSPTEIRNLFPSFLHLTVRVPFSPARWRVTLDLRQAAENSILICSAGYAAAKMCACAREPLSPDLWNARDRLSPEMWISIELALLIIASVVYFFVTRLSCTKLGTISDSAAVKPTNVPDRPASPRVVEGRDHRRIPLPSPTNSGHFGFVWMTVPKNYRDSADDGMLTGLLTGPLMSAALLYIAERALATGTDPRPPNWYVDPPRVLPQSLAALIVARRNLVDLATVCSTILIVHVTASWLTERRHRRRAGAKVPEGEVSSVPRKEGWRTYLYGLFAVSVSMWVLCVRIALAEMRLGIWQNVNYYEIVALSMFFQFSLYISIRMAHHGFTLGELAIVCFGGTVLFMEGVNLTIARIWPITTPFIKTYRFPTPLLIYQLALIPGSLLIGFLLSPLLYLSRRLAQQPVRRLRFPAAKARDRRLLALGFYAGAVGVAAGLVGPWAGWLLGANAWVWAGRWVVWGEGGEQGAGGWAWRRAALMVWWGVLGSVSVVGWGHQLARGRKGRRRAAVSGVASGGETLATTFEGVVRSTQGTTAGNENTASGAGAEASDTTESYLPNFAGIPNLPNLSNLPNIPNGAQMANEWLEGVPTLGMNARRKFFHALAVVMFVPGVAVDPAFLHLAFSGAFALFVFAEYVRYFALYPVGAAVHVFMNAFLDQKDAGTAILSHFYLLIGCAGCVWFEGLLLYTGTLVLGVGDAMASIVGKRFGRHRWVATSGKTVEGSVALVASVVASAWLLRVCGCAERFSVWRYAAVLTLGALLEGFSVQNDNVVLPLYVWTMLVFAEV